MKPVGLRSGEAFRMEMFGPSKLPTSVAGRVDFLCEMMLGIPIVDEDGNPTGERTEPLIDKATFLRLMEAL